MKTMQPILFAMALMATPATAVTATAVQDTGSPETPVPATTPQRVVFPGLDDSRTQRVACPDWPIAKKPAVKT